MKDYTYNQLGLLFICLVLVGLLLPSASVQATPKLTPLFQEDYFSRFDVACNMGPISSDQKIIPPASPTLPYWLFVMNFNRGVDASHLFACVLLYPRGWQTPHDIALKVPCVLKGMVRRTVSFDQASFRKGYVRCPVNLQHEIDRLVERSPSLRDLIRFENQYNYPQFTIIAIGQLSSTGRTDSNYSNPIIAYHPINISSLTIVQRPDIALFAPLQQSSVATIVSAYGNGSLFDTRVCRCNYAFSGSSESQQWQMKLAGGVLSYKRNSKLLDEFSAMPPVTFRPNGGEFRIGGSLLGPPFRGELDLVIVDPTGSIPPQ